jgi:hypothetical protein
MVGRPPLYPVGLDVVIVNGAIALEDDSAAVRAAATRVRLVTVRFSVLRRLRG